MAVRFYIDPTTDEPHIYGHGVTEAEVEDVLAWSVEDRPGRDGARVALGQTAGGRYLRVIYVHEDDTDSAFVITAFPLSPKAMRALRRRLKKKS